MYIQKLTSISPLFVNPRYIAASSPVTVLNLTVSPSITSVANFNSPVAIAMTCLVKVNFIIGTVEQYIVINQHHARVCYDANTRLKNYKAV